MQYAGVEAYIPTPLMKPRLPVSCIILFFIQYCSWPLIDCGGKVMNQLFEHLKDVLEYDCDLNFNILIFKVKS